LYADSSAVVVVVAEVVDAATSEFKVALFVLISDGGGVGTSALGPLGICRFLRRPKPGSAAVVDSSLEFELLSVNDVDFQFTRALF
jgi:hypothetical protein